MEASGATGRAAPASQRIEALDFVRGIALFGILLLNITAFGLPLAYVNPMNAGGAEGANLWVWIVNQVGVEGTQRALFSILFGAGVILLTERLEAAGRIDTADIYFRRNAWLIGFGMVDAYIFLWYGDILYTYGVIAFFVFVFRKAAPKTLLIIGIVALLLAAAWNAKDTAGMLGAYQAKEAAEAAQASGAELTLDQQHALDTWEEKKSEFEAAPDTVAADVEAKTSGYARAFDYTAGLNSYWQSWGLYRYFFDVFGMMLIGMALFKLGVLTLERPSSLYWAMVIIGYGIGLSVNLLEVRHIMANEFSALAFSQANISYDLGRLPTTMGHLGALLLFVRSGALPWLRRAVAAVGRMALTSYLTHSIVCAIIFVGFGLYGQLERHQLYYIVFAIWAVQLVASPLWLRQFRFGPAEWLWRYLSYGRRPAMRYKRPPIGPVAPAL